MPASLRAIPWLASNTLPSVVCTIYCLNIRVRPFKFIFKDCGDTFANGGAPTPAGDCSMVCNGNSGEFCGGPNRLNVYTTSATTTPQSGWVSLGCYRYIDPFFITARHKHLPACLLATTLPRGLWLYQPLPSAVPPITALKVALRPASPQVIILLVQNTLGSAVCTIRRFDSHRLSIDFAYSRLRQYIC